MLGFGAYGTYLRPNPAELNRLKPQMYQNVSNRYVFDSPRTAFSETKGGGSSKYVASGLKEADGVYRKAAVESGGVIIQLLCMLRAPLCSQLTPTAFRAVCFPAQTFLQQQGCSDKLIRK